MIIRRLAAGDEAVVAALATFAVASVGGRDEDDGVVWDFEYTAR